MLKTPLILLCLLFTALFVYGAPLPEDAPEGTIFTYKPQNGERGEIEIHFPEGYDPATARVPGVILFHGGGWSKGNRSQFRELCHYLASRGLVAATAHYRFADQAKIESPAATRSRKRVCITDAKSAIRWFKQNAAQLGIDPERVIAGGGSAGGHIALLATNTPGLNDPEDSEAIDTSVVAYLLFNPAFKPADDQKDPEVDVERNLSSKTAPMIVFWGTEDDFWLRGWNRAYARMQALDIDGSVEWWSAVGAGHGFFNKEPWRTLTFIKADRFLVEQGILTGEPTITAPHTQKKLVRGHLSRLHLPDLASALSDPVEAE